MTHHIDDLASYFYGHNQPEIAKEIADVAMRARRRKIPSSFEDAENAKTNSTKLFGYDPRGVLFYLLSTFIAGLDKTGSQGTFTPELAKYLNNHFCGRLEDRVLLMHLQIPSPKATHSPDTMNIEVDLADQIPHRVRTPYNRGLQVLGTNHLRDLRAFRTTTRSAQEIPGMGTYTYEFLKTMYEKKG